VTGSYEIIKPTPFGQKYVLLNHIKSGGMAAVWLGKMPVFGDVERLVAIKRILPHVAEDTEFISMFIDEAKITVQLNHPNVCKIYELGQDLDARSYYIVMEYVHGRDLRALFDWCEERRAPPPIPVVCYIIACCCDGLNYAHCRKDAQGNEMRIVHRDVSLQNILVSFEGDVKIIDFGIAKAVNKSTQTAAGTLKGKFSYMSPEQICGPPEKVDRRSDVFGIGICLYEMLTGKRLFSGKTDFSVLEKVRKAEVALPTTHNRNIPLALEKIVMKALAREVEDRYQYASEVGDDLWHFLYGLEETFDRRALAKYMQTSFAQQYADEKKHLQECLAAPVQAEPSGKYPVLVEQTDEQPALSEQAARDKQPVEQAALGVDSTVLVEKSSLLSEASKAELNSMQTGPVDVAPPRHPAEGVSASGASLNLKPASKSADGLSSTPTPVSVLGLLETPHDGNRRAPPSSPGASASRPSGTASSTRKPKSVSASVARSKALSSKMVFRGAEKRMLFVQKKYLWVWIVSLLTLLTVVVVLLWPAPMGNVLVEIPEELAGSKVQLFLNDKEMLDKEGNPLQRWPRLFQVPAGKLRVSMSAEGYEPLVVEMVVPEGPSYVRLPQTLKKN